MKAVILPAGDSDRLKPLTSWMPEYLLPVVNKAIVEHLIELLVRHNIKDIILILKHIPYEVEQYFGSGQRWGCNISYSLERSYDGIIPVLNRIRSRLKESFLCLQGNCVTNIDISDLVKTHAENNTHMTIIERKDKHGGNSPVISTSDELDRSESFYPFVLTPDALSSLSSAIHTKYTDQLISASESCGLTLHRHPVFFDFRSVNSIEDYLEINKLVLRGGFKGIIIPGKEIQPGLWVGRKARIHPGVSITSPSLIGSHCNVRDGALIGEDSIIGNGVVVDCGASTKGSIIFDNTYLGAYTEIKDSVIRKNFMIHVPRLTNIYVGDDFILGDLDKKFLSEKGERLFNLIVALFLLLLSFPILTILWLYHMISPSKEYLTSKKHYGQYEVVDLQGNKRPKTFKLYRFRSRYKLISKLPGLLNVIRGDINLVGNSALTSDEVDSLTEEWETLRFESPSGLIQPWEIMHKGDPGWEERIVTECFYARTRNFWGDLKILLKGGIRT